MPREVRITTQIKLKRSGPKNEVNTPGARDTEGSLTWARLSMAC